MNKTMTSQDVCSAKNQGGRTIPGREASKVKLLAGILLLFTVLASGCQPIEPTAASSPETEQAHAFLDLESDVLDMDAPVPLDESIRKAQLDNGLTYYVRHNTEPANRATLMLVVNAGSVQEDDDQLGLAHFLEHMMFNGTERFPKQGLVEYFESIGMSFGPDVNATTSFDETVYILEFPTDDEEIISTTFQVAEDWASRATISEEEVEAERGVIVEEKRFRESAFGRYANQLQQFILEGSRYAERDPIGDMEIIRTAPAETLRRYYEDWYRPDLMAVIVVGDIDVDATEAKIIEHFGGLSLPDDARTRAVYTLPEHDDTHYLIFTDPEFGITLGQIIYRQAADELNTGAAFRENLIGSLFITMLNYRLADITEEADSPFLAAFVSEGQYTGGVSLHTLGVIARPGEVASSLDAALTEVERVRRHGFTAAELERAKSEVLNIKLRLYNDRDNLSNRSLATECRRNFLENKAVPGIEFEYRMTERLLAEISLDDVNQKVEQSMGVSNRSVLVSGAELDADSLPNQQDLANVFEAVQAKQIDPYQDIEAVTELLTEIPEPVEIVSRQTDKTYNITDLTLANGVRVLLKPTNFKEEEVLFSASSPGGSSLVSDEDYPEADFIASIVSLSAVSDVSYAALQRLLADQSVSVSPYISELEEGFYGDSGREHVETLFQLIYLYSTAPNADDDAFASFKDEQTESLRYRELAPGTVVTDALIEARYGASIRHHDPTLEIIDTLDLERAFAIYQERFADFSDFTFIFMGNFDVEQMVDWSQRYLGNLPSTNRVEIWQDVVPDPPAGIVTVPVYKGQAEKGGAAILFTGPAEDTLENRLHLRILQTIVGIMVREDLREERGGIYTSSAAATTVPDPDSLYEISLVFASDPGRVGEMVDALFALITELQSNGPRDDLLEAAQAQYIRQREVQLEKNSYWLNVLKTYATEEDVDLASLVDLEVVESRANSVTAADIQAAAQEFLPLDRYILVTLYPEDYEQ